MSYFRLHDSPGQDHRCISGRRIRMHGCTNFSFDSGRYYKQQIYATCRWQRWKMIRPTATGFVLLISHRLRHHAALLWTSIWAGNGERTSNYFCATVTTFKNINYYIVFWLPRRNLQRTCALFSIDRAGVVRRQKWKAVCTRDLWELRRKITSIDLTVGTAKSGPLT